MPKRCRFKVITIRDDMFATFKKGRITLNEVKLKRGVKFDLCISGDGVITLGVSAPGESLYTAEVELDDCLPPYVLPRAAVNLESLVEATSMEEVAGIAMAQLVIPYTRLGISYEDQERIYFDLQIDNPSKGGRRFETERYYPLKDTKGFLTITSDEYIEE